MKWLAALILSGFALTARAAPLTLQPTVEVAADPLTTENGWVLERHELNPHRQRWLIERALSFDGKLEAVSLAPEKGKARFGVRASVVRSRSTLYVRAAGPSYRAIQEFRCEQEPNGWFATEEGSGVAARAAAAAWNLELEQSLPKLAARLEGVSAPSAAIAANRATQVLRSWKRDAEVEWWVKGRARARVTEWRHYLEQAAALGVCKNATEVAERAKFPAPRWEELMEPPRPEQPKKFLARAPAQRWGGLFTIRVEVDAGRRLNGRFLVDSGAAMSILNPRWLENQGVNPALIEMQDVPAQRVSWSGGSDLARRAFVFDVSVAGAHVPLNEFLLMETPLFSPPDHSKKCCDGVLGADFLRQFAVEFLPGPPSAIRLWPRESFSHGGSPAMTWVELATLPTGEAVSPCNLLASDEVGISVGRWDTGSNRALEIHTPWVEKTKTRKKPWGLYCGAVTVAQELPVEFAETASGKKKLDDAPFGRRLPAYTIGMPILARGPFTFDLAHGRLWLSREGLAARVPVNESGLEVKFSLNAEGDRELRVLRLKPGSPAALQLGRVGLKAGLLVTHIASRPVQDMDLWEVEQRLAGVESDRITVQWKSGKDDKIGFLRL